MRTPGSQPWSQPTSLSGSSHSARVQLRPDGVLAELTKRILERGLSEELTDHLGYESGDPAGRGSGNNRNGTTPKTVLTEIGAIDLDIPRARNGTFEPQLVPQEIGRAHV